MQHKETEKSLTIRQRQAIEALITQGTPTKAAAAASVDRVTLYRWMQLPHFTAALRQAQAEARDAFNLSLFALHDKALAALDAGLDKHQKINVRLSSARLYFDAYHKFIDLADMESRLAELESNYAF